MHVFDPYGFQKTFLDTFLITSFVWNKKITVELSRNKLGMKHNIFEPGGELWNHINKIKLIEKKSAASTFDFVDLSSFEERCCTSQLKKGFNMKPIGE